MVFREDMKHSDVERWICIYPAYINCEKSRAAGRRVPLSKAVATPTFDEIRDVLVAAGLATAVENRTYPRENSRELAYRGRVRVQLRDDCGASVLPHLSTRDMVLHHLCEMIPRLKSRVNRPATGPANDSGAHGSSSVSSAAGAVAALSGAQASGGATGGGQTSRRKTGKRH